MTAQVGVSASGQLTAGDIYCFSLTTLFRRFWWFLLIMVVVAVFFVTSLSSGTAHWEWTWGNVWGPLFPFVFVPYAFFLAPYLAARKQVKINPNLSGPITYVFSDEGIQIKGPNSVARLDWRAIVEVRETSEQFLLYPQQAIAQVIPKRFLPTPQYQSALRSLFRAHVAKLKLRK
jgi:hypothetical protein